MTLQAEISNGTLLVEERLDGRIVILTLDRPKVLNAIDEKLATALETEALRLAHAPQVDAVILTGHGRAFCAGGDVTSFGAALRANDGGGLPAFLDALASRVHRAIEHLVTAGPLLVGAINGSATGAGLGLVCACDFAYARPDAVLRAGFSRLGLSPDTGTTYFLPRIVGYRKALEILLGGAAVKPDAALALGIFNEVIDADEGSFLDEVVARTTALVSIGSAASATRRLLRASASASLQEQLAREKESLIALAGAPAVDVHLRRVLGG